MDVLLLSRLQFALTSAFHYIYPPLSIGLGVVLVAMEAAWLKTGDGAWNRLARFWTRVFGLIFAVGVATGIVLEFEFGTNWAEYSRFVGDVFGSPLAAEGVFAFFLESGFLALLLFGWDRVGPKLHFFATCMVALGAHFSAVWILIANSWMQTPAGYHLVQAAGGLRAEITDFWGMVFNPSSLDRLSHTVLAAWQAGAWLVISVSAWHLLKRRHEDAARRALPLALGLAMLASLGSLASGHGSAATVAETQPAKLAAFEGHWEVSAPADLYLFGWVDAASETTRGLALPGGLGWLLDGDPSTPVTGLRAFAPEDRPPVAAVFQSYHAMVAIGMALIGLSAVGLWRLRGGRLFGDRRLLALFVPAVLLPQLGNQLGWISAELGRQPWLVHGVLRTADGLSPAVESGSVLFSLGLFTAVYALLFVVFLTLLHEKIQHGPEPDPAADGLDWHGKRG